MAIVDQLDFNHPAPDAALLRTSGARVRLSSLWARRPVLLAFTRHYGCTQCKEMLEGLVAGRKDLQKAGLKLAVILQGTPAQAAEFARLYAPGLLCLADPNLDAYRAYGLARGTLFQTLLNPKVWSAVSRSRRKGYRVEPPPAGQDAMQMSGMFIVSPEGRVLLPYYFDHIADHPPMSLLLGGVLATRWDQRFDGPVAPPAPRRRRPGNDAGSGGKKSLKRAARRPARRSAGSRR
jgi:peroxiredoxin